MPEEVTTMTELITDLGTVGTAIVGEVPKIAKLITGEPLLLLTVGFLFFGGCIGIFGRLLSRN